MSMWADGQIRFLLKEVEALKLRLANLESAKEPEIVFPEEHIDKRTKQWRDKKVA